MEYDANTKKGEFSQRQLALLARGIRWYREAFRSDSRPRSWIKIAEDILTWEGASAYFPEIDSSKIITGPIGKKADSGWPLSGQTLERWIIGMAGPGGHKRYTRPEHHKLVAISEFLIANRFVVRDQLLPAGDFLALVEALSPWTGKDTFAAKELCLCSPVETLRTTKKSYVLEVLEFNRINDSASLRVDISEQWYFTSLFPDAHSVFAMWQKKRPYRKKRFFGVCAPIASGLSIQFFLPEHKRYDDSFCSVLRKKCTFELNHMPENRGEFTLNRLQDSAVMINQLVDKEIDVSLTSHFFSEPSRKDKILTSGGAFRSKIGSKKPSADNVLWEKLQLNMRLYGAVEEGEAEKAAEALENGANANFFHWTSPGCVLHNAAVNCCWDVVKILLSVPDIDPLVEDHDGAYPSDLATADSDLADELFFSELSAARSTGRVYRGHRL
ncbi:hypothetical protein [Profundibacter amoris]|uniref:Ankyrin repeat domain-containing protein n=1 Tax=Profundibacter amoris TaxID=2171755 RepID=A0A347UGV7_9RHOB|nr:hypothetical protein [Profundibacter amoris]AXX98085.1 hypothetical protein BAR1_09160 [Profundibacter amoris]